MFKKIIFLISILSTSAFADLPKNNLKIPVSSNFANEITEARFNEIIGRVENFYSPIVKSKKAVLVMNKNWADETVNASANRFGGNAWFVNMYGGLARHPLVTDDGFMLVVCHEMGHHLGGFPTKGGINGFWAATEGQADYFGTLKCLKNILKDDDNQKIVESMVIDPYLKAKCSEKNVNANEQALCERVGMASLSLAKLLSSLKDNAPVNFETPDKSAVKKTNKDHPAAQCRLDTYFAGIMCDKVDGEFSRKDPMVNACLKHDGYNIGYRPLCWYKPGRRE